MPHRVIEVKKSREQSCKQPLPRVLTFIFQRRLLPGHFGRNPGDWDVGIPSPAKAVLLLSPSQSPFLWDSLVELKNPLGIPLACEIPAELCPADGKRSPESPKRIFPNLPKEFPKIQSPGVAQDGGRSLPKESRMLLSPKNPSLHQARPCQGNPVCLELFIPLPVLLQHTIPGINML